MPMGPGYNTLHARLLILFLFTAADHLNVAQLFVFPHFPPALVHVAVVVVVEVVQIPLAHGHVDDVLPLVVALLLQGHRLARVALNAAAAHGAARKEEHGRDEGLEVDESKDGQ